jgi:hypothetical protein
VVCQLFANTVNCLLKQQCYSYVFFTNGEEVVTVNLNVSSRKLLEEFQWNLVLGSGEFNYAVYRPIISASVPENQVKLY